MGQPDNTEELEKLRDIGPRTRRLKLASPRETALLALYALHSALTDNHWNELPDRETVAALQRCR